MIEYYDKIAGEYEGLLDNLYFKLYDRITWKNVQPFLPSTKPARILDLAGGTGRWSRRISGEGSEVLLLDLSQKMLSEGRARGRSQGLRLPIDFVRADAMQIPCKDCSFDLVLCEHALLLVDNITKVVLEMHRVARREGVVILTAQSKYPRALIALRDSPRDAIEILRDKPDNTRAKMLSVNGFLSIIRESGLVVEKVVGKGFSALTMSEKKLLEEPYTPDEFSALAEFEEMMSALPEAVHLAVHIHVIARKPP